MCNLQYIVKVKTHKHEWKNNVGTIYIYIYRHKSNITNGTILGSNQRDIVFLQNILYMSALKCNAIQFILQ